MTALRAAIFNYPPRQPVAGLLAVIARLSVLLVFLAPVFFAANAARAQGVVKSKFGDWEIRCDTPAGTPPQRWLIYHGQDNIIVRIIARAPPGRGSSHES